MKVSGNEGYRQLRRRYDKVRWDKIICYLLQSFLTEGLINEKIVWKGSRESSGVTRRFCTKYIPAAYKNEPLKGTRNLISYRNSAARDRDSNSSKVFQSQSDLLHVRTNIIFKTNQERNRALISVRAYATTWIYSFESGPLGGTFELWEEDHRPKTEAALGRTENPFLPSHRLLKWTGIYTMGEQYQ